MEIRFTLKSPKTHIFEYRRDDGSGEEVELETKSLLLHDFTHYALEVEAGLTKGFFGLLRAGANLGELAALATENREQSETVGIERIVGPLSSHLESESSDATFLELIDSLFSAIDQETPEWLNVETLERVRERYIKTKGEFNSLKFGETLSLRFPLYATPDSGSD